LKQLKAQRVGATRILSISKLSLRDSEQY